MNLIRNVTNDFKAVFTASLQDKEAVDLSFTSDEFTSGLLVEFHLKGVLACPFSEHMSRIHPTAARLFERSTGQLYCFHGKSQVISRHASEVGIQYDSASRSAFIHYRLPCRESLAHIAMAARQYQKIEVSLDVGWSEIALSIGGSDHNGDLFARYYNHYVKRHPRSPKVSPAADIAFDNVFQPLSFRGGVLLCPIACNANVGQQTQAEQQGNVLFHI